MRFISYSQNNEDVLLWRALGHVRDGFYIDVGANDPVEHSVTKAFYDAGWRGINIEPLPAHIAAFDAQRPGDVNLAVAAGSEAGTLTLYDVPAVRGWASPERSVADLHRAEGHTVSELTVPVRTLADVCAEHVHGDVHFLKIDVEGFEGEVLRGMDFTRWRPWVLVIEATLPNSRATNHASWEHLVTDRRYRYAWFDGLNRYYVAEEHAELMDSFGIQPNVFDDYISHHLDKAWAANRAATTALLETQLLADTSRAELHDMMQLAANLELEKQEALAEIAQLRHDLAQAHANGHQATLWARDLEARLTAQRARHNRVVSQVVV
jgi:FkbM family methyltransferase